MKKQLFQYVVILHKFEEKENGKVYKDSEIIVQPTYLLAKSEKDVVFAVTRQIPEEHASNPDNIEIVVRNF